MGREFAVKGRGAGAQLLPSPVWTVLAMVEKKEGIDAMAKANADGDTLMARR
jgi:hypothetical protein